MQNTTSIKIKKKLINKREGITLLPIKKMQRMNVKVKEE